MSEETIPQMRERIKELEKSEKALTRENEALQKDVRRFGARDAFRDQGLPAAHGDLYAAQNPEGEITAEGVMEFVESFNLGAPSGDSDGDASDSGGGDAPEAAGDGNENLDALSRSGSRPGDGNPGGASTEQMTRDEWTKLYSRDPAAAKAAVASGSVEISEGNPYVKQTAGVGRDNPYAP
jgi:hypothetical protein